MCGRCKEYRSRVKSQGESDKRSTDNGKNIAKSVADVTKKRYGIKKLIKTYKVFKKSNSTEVCVKNMRCNLHLAYLGLLSVTCISSLFLFFAVVTENAKYVVACNAGATALPGESDEAITADAGSAGLPHDVEGAVPTATHEDVLPNYKKVKKSIHAATESPMVPQHALHANAYAPGNENSVGDAPNVATLIPSGIEATAQSAEGWSLPNVGDSVDANGVINVKYVVYTVSSEVPEQQEFSIELAEAAATNDETLLAPQGSDLQDAPTKYEQKDETKTSSHESLPDITEIPTITVTELPLEILESTRGNIDALVIEAAKETISREHENLAVELSENSSEAIRKDEEIIKFDDSGGGEKPSQAGADLNLNEIPENIPNANVTIVTPTPTPEAAPTQAESTSPTPVTAGATISESSEGNSAAGSTVNLTTEEVPIPVFSEWAQKQMEAAEKQQAKEQEVVNTSSQKKNHTNGDGKRVAPLKMRNKNYASPDCGAKIIASNSDASNTGAVLSSSKDEYMLSPCGNRIWFVVELCEAIQAQKVELANFELFSSSPKNFTVAVSNRFPTRDWSNVGRFIAEDKRNVQSFELHPHLFGKFVRVDIHSHYSKEHFCPVSLFRVFGTSEFEAFETENQLNVDLDDFEDEFAQEQVHAKNTDTNLFKSASDAVLSIVKKAAEVLVKPTNNQNMTLMRVHTPSSHCLTLTAAQYTCADCNQPLVERVNNALSCQLQQLQALLQVPYLYRDLLRTRICAKKFGIESKGTTCTEDCSDVRHSYYLNMLPPEYVGALCQLLVIQDKVKYPRAVPVEGEGEDTASELPLNLTVDKKLKKDDLKIIDDKQKSLETPEAAYVNADSLAGSAEATFGNVGKEPIDIVTTESSLAEDEQLARPSHDEAEILSTTTTVPNANTKEPAPDVNIFNVPVIEQKLPQQTKPSELTDDATIDAGNDGSSGEYAGSNSITTTPISPPAPPTSTSTGGDGSGIDSMPPPLAATIITTTAMPLRSEEDTASWENIENLLTSTTAAPSAGATVSDTVVHGSQAGVNLQQKIPSGPQSESVFIRLSNRIKALERNMSLSGQYLEELSRRYKKQVEELQLTLTQTVQTVRTLEEQHRRQSELHQLLAQRNAQLKEELDDLSLQIHACIVVIIFVGAFVFLVLMVSILFYRSMRRETKELLSLYMSTSNKKTASAVAAMQKKLKRRKSFEDFSDHQQSVEKLRRPSEEALMIIKDRSSVEHAAFENVGDAGQARNLSQRERKISICYSSNQLNCGGAIFSGIPPRRKGEKHSWPNTEHAQLLARRHLEQLHATNEAGECKYNRNDINSSHGRPPRAPILNGEVHKSAGNKPKRKLQLLRRQESAPHYFTGNERLNSNTSAKIDTAEYDESLRLEEDGLDNFIPTADLAYNEFMPEGPSGYQVDDGAARNGENKKLGKKLGRLSSPGFFKSPFSKSLKLRASKSSKHPHESTSWEWYRSKNAEAKQLSSSASASGGFMRASPTVSLDSSSLSEILIPSSRTENSFRILEEAILSSGENKAANNGGTRSVTAENVFS